MSEVRSMYIEGKHAVIPNLPHPHIQDFHDHSYVNIEEIIKHYLYSGMYTLVFSNWTEINYKNEIGKFNNKDLYYYRIADNG